MVISAAPFLLPLMFQVGFGWSPVLAGGLVLLLFVGNMAIKPATSPLIRRFGFRAVLIVSIAGGAIVFGLIATLSATSPLPWVAGAAVAERDLPVHRLQRLQLAAVRRHRPCPHVRRQHAVLDHAAGGGRAGDRPGRRGRTRGRSLARPVGAARLPYAVAFLVLGLLMVWPLVGAIRLHRSAGDEVAGR